MSNFIPTSPMSSPRVAQQLTDPSSGPTPTARTNTGPNQSKCKFCRQFGHSISKCTDQRMQHFTEYVTHAANYSIGYQPGPVYLTRALKAMLSKDRHAVCVYLRLGSRDNTDAIVNALYTVPMTNPNAVELAKAAVEASPRGLHSIDHDLKESYHFHVHFGDSPNFAVMYTNHYVPPCCPREEALYLEKKREIERREREFEYDQTRRRLITAYANVVRLREEMAAAGTVWRDANQAHLAANQALTALDPVQVRKFEIKTEMAKPVEDGTAALVVTATLAVDCPICYETVEGENVIRTNCGHNFCQTCLTKCLSMAQQAKTNKHPCCAMCRAPTTTLVFNSQEICQAITEQFCR